MLSKFGKKVQIELVILSFFFNLSYFNIFKIFKSTRVLVTTINNFYIDTRKPCHVTDKKPAPIAALFSNKQTILSDFVKCKITSVLCMIRQSKQHAALAVFFLNQTHRLAEWVIYLCEACVLYLWHTAVRGRVQQSPSVCSDISEPRPAEHTSPQPLICSSNGAAPAKRQPTQAQTLRLQSHHHCN